MAKFCQHCGSPLAENKPNCPNCGESSPTDHQAPSFKDFFKEFINYDKNIWYTLRLMIFKPGVLTAEFLKNGGKTVTSPAKLFIIASALSFILGSIGVLDKPEKESTPPALAAGEEKPGLQLEFTTSEGVRIKNIQYYRDEIDSLGPAEFYTSRNIVLNPILTWVVVRTIKKYQANDYEEISINHQRNASILLYLLIPFFAFLLKPLGWKRSFTEHISFTLYFFSAFFIWQLILNYSARLIYFTTGFGVPFILIISVFATCYLIISIYRHYQINWAYSFLASIIYIIILIILMSLLLFFSSLLIIGF